MWQSAFLVVLMCPVLFLGCEPDADRGKGSAKGANATNEAAAVVANMEGMKLLGYGNYIDALAQFERAVQLDEKPDYLNNLGRTLFFLGRNDTALRAFSRAVRLGKEDADILCNIGDVHMQMDQKLDAIELYQRAIRITPNHPRAHYALGELYLREGQYADAEYRLNMALQAAPNHDRALLSRVILYNLMGEHDSMYYERAHKDLQILERRGYEVNPDLRRRVVRGYLAATP